MVELGQLLVYMHWQYSSDWYSAYRAGAAMLHMLVHAVHTEIHVHAGQQHCILASCHADTATLFLSFTL